jgi:quercetin dioxygenase-like cupin family protein
MDVVQVMVIHANDIPTFRAGRTAVAGLATRRRGAERIMLWRVSTDPGAEGRAHRHDAEEVVLVLAGSGRLLEAGGEHPFGPGDVLVIPANLLHRVAASPVEPCEYVAAMGTDTHHFTELGEEMDLPWSD